MNNRARQALSSNATIALVCGATILTLTMGIRQTFGLFLTPMSGDLGISREAFALAIAMQNLLWGLFQPFAGMFADRYGIIRVLLLGAAAYAIGLGAMAGGGGLIGLNLGGGMLVGLALSCTSFAVVLGAISRAVPAERRSAALGIASAGGSFGQFVMAPIGQSLISAHGWSDALLILAGLALLMAPLAVILARATRPSRDQLSDQLHVSNERESSLSPIGALGEAGRHRGYWYLTIGFFVCGFQVVFIGVHLPAYLVDLGMTPDVGATALALIGFFNIVGTWGCGVLGGRHSKKRLLAGLYLLRAMTIAVFLAAPKTETTVLVFAATIGLLWLGTVPLTSGLVGQIFGVHNLGMLFGLVFFSHQVGSFLGVWLGGLVFDVTGSYDVIWLASIGLGVIAAALHLPISERSLRPSMP
ncbi:MAG: MFS transporter [Hyphomicrobiales bacterium]|nr:MFS transporter [Hyphomicrobiales bacterium]